MITNTSITTNAYELNLNLSNYLFYLFFIFNMSTSDIYIFIAFLWNLVITSFLLLVFYYRISWIIELISSILDLMESLLLLFLDNVSNLIIFLLSSRFRALDGTYSMSQLLFDSD